MNEHQEVRDEPSFEPNFQSNFPSNLSLNPADENCQCLSNIEYFNSLVSSLNQILIEEPIKSAYFILHANYQTHQLAASVLASQLTHLNLGQKIQTYLSYYSHYEDESATAYYDWTNQCHNDRCSLAKTILSANQNNLAGKSCPVNGFENAVDLGLQTVNMLGTNNKLPFCQRGRNGEETKHEERLVIFFTHFKKVRKPIWSLKYCL